MVHRTLARFRSFLRRRARGVGLPERLVIYAIIWWILTEGDLGSFAFGAPAIAAAALINPFAPGRPRGWRLARGARFLAIFAWLSLRSALDVARRAVHPARPLNPARIDYSWRLQTGSARQFMANLLNLMPGTLTIHSGEETLMLHVLGPRERALAGVRRLEGRVAGLFGEVVAGDE